MNIDARERWARIAALPLGPTGAAGRGLMHSVIDPIVEIWRRRELLGLLVRRELKARFKDSSLGFLWTLIRPLTLLLIYFVAIGQFLGAARAIPDFAIFVFSGLTLWGLYSEILLAGTSSILGNAGLVKKVYLPREIFPLAAAGSTLVTFAIQLGILLGTVVLLGRFRLSWDLLYAPVAIGIVLVYAVALALLFSALNVYLRDVQYLVEVGMLIFFWASPIVYSWSFVVAALPGWLAQLYLANPVTTALLAFQRALWAAGSEATPSVDALGEPTVVPPQPWPADLDVRLAVTFFVGLVLAVVAQRVFARLQGNFAQEI